MREVMILARWKGRMAGMWIVSVASSDLRTSVVSLASCQVVEWT
jgi:hypothetical protein